MEGALSLPSGCLALAWRGREHRNRCTILEVKYTSGRVPGSTVNHCGRTEADNSGCELEEGEVIVGWRGLGRIPGGPEPALVGWVWSVITESRAGFPCVGQVDQVQMGRWGKEIL